MRGGGRARYERELKVEIFVCFSASRDDVLWQRRQKICHLLDFSFSSFSVCVCVWANRLVAPKVGSFFFLVNFLTRLCACTMVATHVYIYRFMNDGFPV